MPKNGKRGGGDRVLESRHLVLLFLSVVLLCGVFFTLGYVMGHTQYGGAVHAADPPLKTTPPAPASVKNKETNPAPPASDPNWDNYDPTKKSTDNHIEPAPKPAPKAVPAANSKTANPPSTIPVSAKAPIPAAKQPAKYAPPASIGKNSIVLQVAAVKQQRDALEMADELQKKKFPAFVINSQADGFYHVQVGPYPDKPSADAARHALEEAGFKAIIKR
jgi:cell division septation protein DedD